MYQKLKPKSKGKSEKTALVTAVDILSRADQSSARLKEKLQRRGYADEEVSHAIETLTDRGYLDDGETCQHQFDFLYEESRQSVQQIMAKLFQRGFSKEDIRACVPSDIYEREKAAALRVISMKYRKGASPQKMKEYLYRKGYDIRAIHAAVEEFADAPMDDEEVF